MHGFRPVALAALVATGCGEAAPPPQHIQAWVESWADMGMYLPTDEQVDFLRINYRDVEPELEAALSHEDPDVRQRAAYVIGEIGPTAKSLGPALVRRLKNEKERLVRIYIVDAIAAIEFQAKEAKDALRSQFGSLSSENVAPQSPGEYADVDEKIAVAASLFKLTDGEERQKYLDFVTQWLDPPEPDLAPAQLEGYWERRWMAVNSLERMPGASSAIPRLESMLQEKEAKTWVPVHVPRVLKALKKPGT